MRSKSEFKEIPFALDRSRRGDLAAQIAAGLRMAIETGFYKAGDILPPVRDLAPMLDVSKGIAEQALALVREEGLINPRPRVGCVVLDRRDRLWKGHVVIVVPPGRGNPLDNMIHVTVRDSLIAAGYLVSSASVAETAPGKFNDFALLDTVLRQPTDLVVQLQGQECVARWLSRRGIPFVRLGLTDLKPPNCVGLVRRDDDLVLADFVAHCQETGVKSVTRFPYSTALTSRRLSQPVELKSGSFASPRRKISPLATNWRSGRYRASGRIARRRGRSGFLN